MTEAPRVTADDDGITATAKLGVLPGPETTSPTFTARLTPAAVPVITSGYVPGAVDAAVVTIKVVPVALVPGENSALAPAGSPESPKVKGLAAFTTAGSTEIAKVAEAPAAIADAVGLAVSPPVA